MKIDREKMYFMPLIRGALWNQKDLPKQNYESTESLMLQYETDPEAISPLLPEPFKPGKKPLVTVMFTDNNGVDFMVGDGYRFALFSVTAEFDGKEGHFEGNYILIMPENKTLPILTGREWLGMPKFHTDISSIRHMGDNHLRCEVSLWGHLLFGVDAAPPFRNQNAIVRKAASTMATKIPAFGYKYIAALDGPPDADYPTIMWTDNSIDKLSLGKSGHLYFGNPTEDDIGYFKPIIDSLKTLPVVNVTQVAHLQGSMVLRIDKSGRIN